MTRCSIIIVNTNEGGVLFECLTRVMERSSTALHETIVVDNGSSDGSPERVEREFSWVRLVRAGRNLGYAGANNRGAAVASGDVLVFVNPDAFVEPGWLDAIAPRFDDPAVGAVGPRIFRGRSGDVIDSAGGDIEFPLGDAPGRFYLQHASAASAAGGDVAYLSGAALAVRADAFARLGGFDETFFCYYEETDLCWRMRMTGLRCVYEPNATVRHLGSFTFAKASARKVHLQTRNRIRACLQNLEPVNAARFAAAEAVVGASVIIGSALLPKYRSYAGAYARAWGDTIASIGHIARTRALRQRERTRADAEVLAVHRRLSPLGVLARYARLARQGGDALFAEGTEAAAAGYDPS